MRHGNFCALTGGRDGEKAFDLDFGTRDGGGKISIDGEECAGWIFDGKMRVVDRFRVFVNGDKRSYVGIAEKTVQRADDEIEIVWASGAAAFGVSDGDYLLIFESVCDSASH